jgi:hypothetical protein
MDEVDSIEKHKYVLRTAWFLYWSIILSYFFHYNVMAGGVTNNTVSIVQRICFISSYKLLVRKIAQFWLCCLYTYAMMIWQTECICISVLPHCRPGHFVRRHPGSRSTVVV